MTDFQSFFPKNYKDSQIRFEKLAKALPEPKTFGRWKVDSVSDGDLAVDHLYIPARVTPKKLLILISGVHGSESYAGSAIQEMFLQEILPTLDLANTGIFLVHSLNPYGFKNHSRLTEHKVNLNRNCSSNERMFSIRNRECLELCKRFIPAEPVNSTKSFLLQNMTQENNKVSFQEVTLDQFVKTTCMGQFETPEALEFGGFQPEPQIRDLTAKLQELMPAYSDVVALDLHTGLGHRGRLHILTDSNARGLHQALLGEILDPKSDEVIYEYTPHHHEGFYTVYGGTNNLFAELAADDQRVVALTMEFGTNGHDLPAQLEGLNQAILDHQGTHYGYASEDLKKQIADWTLERSFPSDPAWRNQIVDTAKKFIETVLQRLGSVKA